MNSVQACLFRIYARNDSDMWKILMLAFVCMSAGATDTTALTKRGLYSTCVPACVDKQKDDHSNRAFLETPFVFDAFCSCHCARMAMRISQEVLDKGNRSAFSGKNVTSISEIEQIGMTNFQVCSKILSSQ